MEQVTTDRTSPGVAVAILDNPAGPDAELLAACARFQKVHAVRSAADARESGCVSDEVGRALDIEWDAAFDAVSALKPLTSTGIQARASVAAVGMIWSVKSSVDETWEEQADGMQWLAIDCLLDVAGNVTP